MDSLRVAEIRSQANKKCVKHKYEIMWAREYVYVFRCVKCDLTIPFDKFLFRRLVTGWNPWTR